MLEDRGPNDLTLQIEQLEAKVKFLQGVCKNAGRQINELKEDNKRLANEVNNYIERIQRGAEYEFKKSTD